VRPLAWCSQPRDSATLPDGALAIETLAFIVAGYLAGSLPFGYWVVRWTKGVDIRNVGSGNIGATNVWRTFGPRYAIPVIVLDVLKGFVPALVATLAVGHVAGALAGGAAMLGHWRPLFLRFAKGGKMVATCGGALLGLAPLVGLIGAVVWIIVFALTRYASVSSIVAAASLPVGAAPARGALAGARLLVGGRPGRAGPAPWQPRAVACRHRDAGPAPPQAGCDHLVTDCY
jgi:glycerol-3-phosphate acyltransferase PlsY